MGTLNYIADNVRIVREKIAEAADKCGRNVNDITLIGVTKTATLPEINALIDANVTNLGENRVQDFLPKHLEMTAKNPIWHFIGHLQRNKVKQVVDKVSLIHSVDSIELAREINKRAEQVNRTVDILIEINIANEPTKHGISPTNLNELSEQIFELSNTRMCGLMCVAPFVESAEKNRRFFAKMQDLGHEICAKKNIDFGKSVPYTDAPFHLSMGMSNDYIEAISFNASMIRIGTALLDKQ